MNTYVPREERFSTARHPAFRGRRGPTLRALAIAAIIVMAGVGVVQASGPPTLPSSVKLEQWGDEA